MMNRDTGNSWYSALLKDISRFIGQLGRPSQTHDYVHHQQNRDYVFEQAQGERAFYMTGQGKGIRQGDCIILKREGSLEKYRVQTINYYASPSDTWIALLVKVE